MVKLDYHLVNHHSNNCFRQKMPMDTKSSKVETGYLYSQKVTPYKIVINDKVKNNFVKEPSRHHPIQVIKVNRTSIGTNVHNGFPAIIS